MAYEDLNKVGAMNNFSGSEKVVLWQLSWHLNGNDGQCDPAVETLVEETGVKRSTIFEAFKGLEKKGYLTRIPRKGTSSLYCGFR
jgi:DNA-binding MarR family transcriptional regulator